MSIKPKEQVGLLVLDLDNTVWDWFDAWFKSFSALLEGLQRDTGLSLETLKNEMRTVHRNRGTTEYSLLLDELPSLQPFLGNQTVRERFDNALHEQNSKRKHETRLYPGVMTTLQHVKARGVKIIAYTESLSYWTEWRIKLTGLDGVIDFLYSSPDHDFPAGVTAKSIRTLPKGEYGLKTTQHRHVPRGVSKPDPRILEEIIAEHGEGSQGVAYVGDSLMKDIAMAQTVGVFDVHAAYGEAFQRKEYSLLQELSHWSDATVRKEQSTRRGAHPTPKSCWGRMTLPRFQCDEYYSYCKQFGFDIRELDIATGAAHATHMNTSIATIEPMAAPSYLITAPEAAELVRDALAAGKSDLAIRRLTEAIARLIESGGQDLPDDEFAEPATTGDAKYDAVLATAFLYAAHICRIAAPAWTQFAPLEHAWLWGGDGFESEQYKSLIQSQTPSEFLERNILTRPRDWVNA